MKKDNLNKIRKRFKRGELSEIDCGYLLSLALETIRKDNTSIFGNQLAEFNELLSRKEIQLHKDEVRDAYNAGMLRGAFMACNNFCEMNFEKAGLKELRKLTNVADKLSAGEQLIDKNLTKKERKDLNILVKVGFVQATKSGNMTVYCLSDKGKNAIKIFGKRRLEDEHAAGEEDTGTTE